MSDNGPFRWILIFGFATVAFVGLYYRIRSAASGESLDRRREGWFILGTLRPVGIASIIGVITFASEPELMAWSQVSLPAAIRWIGVPLGVSAIALFIATFRSIGENITDTVVTRKRHRLVTDGPYRYVRHPLYAATLLGTLANGLVTANWFITTTGVTAFALLMVRSKTEERFLIERFGEMYCQYRSRTGAILPRFRA